MKPARWAAVLALLALAASHAEAAVRTETVEYRAGDATMEGYLAYDDSVHGKRPGVLVVHEWWGINDYTRSRAEQLARMGYVAFAPDIYGKGNRAKDAAEAARLANALRGGDRGLMRARADAGLEILRKFERTDPRRVAAVGYCFGGTTALELARGGADILGVVSFHGGLDTPSPGDAARIKARVLVLTGADDRSVPPAQIERFADEMRAGRVDWQLVEYGGAVHGFTNPAGGNDPSKGYAYDEKADRRSWEAMKVFFAEIFK